MITGSVNAQREAVIQIQLKHRDGRMRRMDALIDTGFNHELTLPPALVRSLDLEFVAPAQSTLAADVRINVDCYRAIVHWDGVDREITVLEMEGLVLVGTALLAEYRLTLDITPGGTIRIEPLES